MLRKGAKGHDANSQLALAKELWSGEHVPQDRSAARNWLEQSARKGQPDAQYWLGTLYETGQIKPALKSRAARWYARAAASGNAAAANAWAASTWRARAWTRTRSAASSTSRCRPTAATRRASGTSAARWSPAAGPTRT